MPTRAPTVSYYNYSQRKMDHWPTEFKPNRWRRKGQTLAEKLYVAFDRLNRAASENALQSASAINAMRSGWDSMLQCSACTLFAGAQYTTIFHWTNPLSPTPIIVDHVIVRIGTPSTAAAVMIMGQATITGLEQNEKAHANRAAQNTYGGASRNNIITGIALNTASIYDSRASLGFQRAGTLMQGKFQYLSGRAVTASPAALAGTVYVFWHKAYAGAA